MKYITQYNGGHAFKVQLTNDNVEVYRYKSGEEYNSKPILTFNPQRIFIGKSPLNDMTAFSGGHGEKFDGNLILLKIDDGTYIFFGSEIFEFQSSHEIVEFVSPVGDSHTPYPYAIDTDGNHYLLIEDVIIGNVPKYKDPYDYYYNLSVMKQTTVKDLWNIETFYIGNTKSNLEYRYNQNTAEYYDRLVSKNGRKCKMYIKNSAGGKKKILLKEEFIAMIKEFEKQIKIDYHFYEVLHEISSPRLRSRKRSQRKRSRKIDSKVISKIYWENRKRWKQTM